MPFSRKATQYIFFEMVPSFLLGLVVFVFILLMFQTLRYTEFVLVHGGDMATIGKIIFYISMSFLPALFPMSLLFAILMTYGRLSADSEIVALKASGVGPWTLLLPAAILGVLVSMMSAQTMFGIGPWANRQFEILITQQSQQKAGITLREGTFSEGFFDMVIYANTVDSAAGKIKKVFIFDERQSDVPLTIIAKEGLIEKDEKAGGNAVKLTLVNGDIHRKSDTHTKIKFDSFDIRLADPVKNEMKEKSAQSLNYPEIQEKLAKSDLPPSERRKILTELNKRWAISSACMIFALLGVGLGTVTNRRSQKSAGLIQSLGVIIGYWVLYVTGEGMARSGQAPVTLAIWIPNFIFLIFAIWSLKKTWN